MSHMSSRPEADAPSHAERRVHHRVRAVFTQACALLAPELLRAPGEPQASGYSLAVMVRTHFPELTSAEIHVLITAAQRLRHERRLHLLPGATA